MFIRIIVTYNNEVAARCIPDYTFASTLTRSTFIVRQNPLLASKESSHCTYIIVIYTVLVVYVTYNSCAVCNSQISSYQNAMDSCCS